ncbi:MAG: hypothetical protein RL329_3594 [Bacteroidota bacterium]
MVKYLFEILLFALLYRWLFASKKTIVEHHHHYSPAKKRKQINDKGDYVEYEEIEELKK